MAMRRPTASKAQLKPDSQYHSILVSKFINAIMKDGKKSVATRVVYDAMSVIKEKVPDKPEVEVFEEAIRNVMPNIEVRNRRVGGANYQVPMKVEENRKRGLAFRWIIDAARKAREDQGVPMKQALSAELIDAYNKQGAAMNTREQTHRMADANKAFAHFAF